jgi:hypothetical protein
MTTRTMLLPDRNELRCGCDHSPSCPGGEAGAVTRVLSVQGVGRRHHREDRNSRNRRRAQESQPNFDASSSGMKVRLPERSGRVRREDALE